MLLSKHDIWPIILGVPNTIYFNFKYFKFRDALRFPVLLSNQVWFKSAKGKVVVEKPGFARVRIGFGDVGAFDKIRSRTIWDVKGTVVFKGDTFIGHGSKLVVSGELILGHKFRITAESVLHCSKRIVFGEDVMISWDTLFMDSDGHPIYDMSHNVCNEMKDIIVGDTVWFGCRSTILKGSQIANNTIVAANSCVHGKYEKEYQIIGGAPARTIKEDVTWR